MCEPLPGTSSSGADKTHDDEIEEEFKTIEKHCVYIGNIPAFVSKLELVEKFSKCGEIVNIFVQPNKPHCDMKGAIIRYCSETSVKKALIFNNNEFHKSVLIVIEVGLPHSYYLLTYNTCIAVNVTDDMPMIDVYNEFEKVGRIYYIFKSVNNVIYVNFEEYEDMELAVSTKSFIIKDKILKINKIKKNINMCLLYVESLNDPENNTKVKEYLLYNFKAFLKTKQKMSSNVTEQQSEPKSPRPGPSGLQNQ